MTDWTLPPAASAAQALAQADAALPLAPAFQALPGSDREDLRGKLARVRTALMAAPDTLARPADPYDTDVLARPMLGPNTGYGGYGGGQPTAAAPPAEAEPTEPKSLLRAVNDLPAATGAMADELDFAAFVASLVHGTFDAIVDSSIRQMEAFADLVSSLSQTVENFSRDNVSTNQVRDWLVEKYPSDLQLILPDAVGQQPRVVPRGNSEDEWGDSPMWLSDFDLDGETLSEELIERQIIPRARLRLGEDRMRSLASMALMGLHKVRVERGEISARIRIRAKASDTARVGFAQDQDTGAASGRWSGRAGFSPPAAQAMISTAINAQSDAAIAAELQGEVRIVFASETVPLESFVNDAQRVLLERTARTPVTAARDRGRTPQQIGRDAVADALPAQSVLNPAEPQPSPDGGTA